MDLFDELESTGPLAVGQDAATGRLRLFFAGREIETADSSDAMNWYQELAERYGHMWERN